MNLLHISDMHFGPRHWKGNNELLIDQLNSYSADIVINTGDNTTDGLENEFVAAGEFLRSIKCDHIISIAGNHDKRNMRCQDFFRQHIDEIEAIHPINRDKCQKKHLYLDEYTTDITEHYTDINFVRNISIDGITFLLVCLDTSEYYQDNGFVDREVLRSVSHEINSHSYDHILLLNHHSILDTDSDPLFNSQYILDFIRQHEIEHVFCGHSHKLSIVKTTDLYHQYSFTQYKSGSTTSINTPNDTNMFLYFENFGEADMRLHMVRIFIENDRLVFKEEIIANS